MRRPARLERAGALTPRDRIWAAIRCFGKDDTFSIAEIMVLSEQRDDTALTYVNGLVKAGYLTTTLLQRRPTCRPRREFRRFALARDVGVDAPRVTGDGAPVEQGMGRQQMWNAMRTTKGDFGWRDILLVCTVQHRPAEDEAKTYFRFLVRAGYLKVEREWTSHTEGRYRFLRSRNTGPRAPLISRAKEVIDSNTGQVMFNPKEAIQC